MGERDWEPVCEHVENLNEFYDRDASFDITVDPIIISLGVVQSDHSDSSEEDNSTNTQDDEMGGIALLTEKNR
jgi:hypothetical protein